MIKRILNRKTPSTNQDSLHAELQECRSKLDAISRSQAVIEFQMDGTVIDANENFTTALGYRLDEIVGRHHKTFVDPAEHPTPEYSEFWATLNRGQFHEGEFRRIKKDGSDVWIQAMYYPITDSAGRPVKVVKFASDITERVVLRQQTAEAQSAVTDSIEQMVATIAEIAGHANQTAKQATTTKQAVDKTETTVSMLGDSSREIEKVVDLIRNLADQTNLLALNATIESARAGEAGKGFAVVAHEVKELAKQTAAATESIDTSVTNIQELITDSVQSTALVSENISSVTASMTQVAAAVEEQSATMHCLNESASRLNA